MTTGLLTLTQAAELKGCSRQWIHQLIREGRLKAQKLGASYVIREKDLQRCEIRPRTRPSKKKKAR